MKLPILVLLSEITAWTPQRNNGGIDGMVRTRPEVYRDTDVSEWILFNFYIK